MLRRGVIAFGAAALAGGIIVLALGICPPAFVFVFWGALILLGTVYERTRYKPIENALPPAGWVRTGERFIDDETGRPVTVYMEPATGERKYVRG